MRINLESYLELGDHIPASIITGNDWQPWTLEQLAGPEAGLEDTD